MNFLVLYLIFLELNYLKNINRYYLLLFNILFKILSLKKNIKKFFEKKIEIKYKTKLEKIYLTKNNYIKIYEK